MLLAAFPWDKFGIICAVQAVLTGFFYLIVGSKRNTAAVMGGADADNTKQGATAKHGSPLAIVLAYNTLAIGYASFCSYTGSVAWFGGGAEAIGTTLADRFYGYSAPYARIAELTVAYETYNTLCVLFLHEYRNAAFVGHHFTCLILGLMSMHPFCHYYAIFFFGLTAISSIPLAMIELAQGFEIPAMEEACRVLFCIIFLAIRTCYWPYLSYFYWQDAIAALNGAIPVHNYGVHLFLLASNVGLTGLQFYWTSLIAQGILEKLTSPAPAKEGKAA